MTNIDSSPDAPSPFTYAPPDSIPHPDAPPIPYAITGQPVPDMADTYAQPADGLDFATSPSSLIGEGSDTDVPYIGRTTLSATIPAADVPREGERTESQALEPREPLVDSASTGDQPPPVDEPPRGPEFEDDGEDPMRRLDLPDNMDELLATSLVPSELPGADTEKYYVEGHPDLLVRINRAVPVDDMRTAKEAADRLAQPKYGVNVLPSQIFEHENEAHVVTKRVEGTPLYEVLASDPPDDIIQAVDNTLGGIAKNAVDCLATNEAIPLDVTQPDQFMVGTTAGISDERVILVDLPHTAEPAAQEDVFEEEVMQVANGVNRVEEISGRRMVAARAAIERALPLFRYSSYWGDGLIQATRYVLAHPGTEIVTTDLGSDEQIQGLRTR